VDFDVNEESLALEARTESGALGRRRLFGLAAGGAAAVAGGVLLGAQPAHAATRPRALGGKIVIPKIRVNKALYEGLATSALNLGPGHWPGTPLPGEAGNTVFAGHRVSKHRVFRNIHLLVPGDLVQFQMWYGTFNYEVVGSWVVNPRTAAGDVLNQNGPWATTIFACHPPGSIRYRYVVRAERRI